MQVRTFAAIAVWLLLVLGLALPACSGDSDDSATDSPAATATDDGSEPPVVPALLDQPEPAQSIVAAETTPVNNIVDIVISGAAFENNNIVVPLGEPIVIRVTNSDPQTHNLRIAGLDGEFNTEDDAATDPPSISGGQTGELTFAPPVAGEYTFRCDFHPQSMGGRITVE